MMNSRFAARFMAAFAIGGFIVAPTLGLAFSPDDDHRRGRGNQGKSPKDRGRHDNRDQWWKDRDRDRDRDRRDDWRRREDERRRDEWRRREEQRRREEDRRRDEWRRREEDRRRRDDWRRRDDDWRWRDNDRRQETKNEWRNIAIAAGAVAVLGLLNKDNTLTFAGSAGALYSLYRYEQDRKSQNSHYRARAAYFDRDHFYRDGNRYNRRLVVRNGERYYQFCRD